MSPSERAARALYERWLQQPDVLRESLANGPHPDWEHLSGTGKAKWVDDARAVITAIREPSEAMREPFTKTLHWDNLDQDDVWQAMIDALLEEGK